MPSHSHSGSAAAGGAHTHTIPSAVYAGEGSSGSYLERGGNESISNKTTSTSTTHTHTVSINAAGSGSTHDHGNTGAGGTGYTSYNGTGNTGSAGGTSSYRPATAVGILAEKDGVATPTTWYTTFAGGTAWNYWSCVVNCGSSSTQFTESGPGMIIGVDSESTWAAGFRPNKIRITGVPEGTGSQIQLYSGSYPSGSSIAGPELPATQIEMNIDWSNGVDMDFLYLYGMSVVTEIEFDVDPGGPYG
jgi:hypothetical protein